MAVPKTVLHLVETFEVNIKRQIDSTDRQIDNLVYNLYGLTPEEIEIVEGRVNNEL